MWNKVLGHKRQIDQLRRAIAGNTFASAYLFAGPRGVGKYRVAITLTQQLFCKSTDEHNAPCGACRHCTRIAAGTHPDVHLLAPDPDKTMRDISIDRIRHMQSRLQLHALEGECKIALIDEAEAMQPAAANACLKILEEPPTATHFLLVSAQPHRLLPTIRSRCQLIPFGPLSHDEIIGQLQADGIEPAEARQRATVAEGSLGVATDYPTEVLTETVTDLHQLLERGTAPTVLEVAERWAADTALLPWRLQVIALLWRDAVAGQLSPAAQPHIPATTALLDQLRTRTPRRLTLELQQTLQTAREACETTLNKQLACESLLFRLAGA